MTPYEQLEQLAHSHGIPINLGILCEEDALDGLYVALKDGSCLVLINRHRDLARRTAALAEELGHHFRSLGDLRDLRTIAAAKSEALGHAWSFEALLPQPALERELKNGNGTAWQLAEATDLPEDFIQEAAAYHQRRQLTRITIRDLPAEVQELIKKRTERAASPPAPPPPVPKPSMAEVRRRAHSRAYWLLGYRPTYEQWVEITRAFKTEFIYSRLKGDVAHKLRPRHCERVSNLIRKMYKEMFDEVA